MIQVKYKKIFIEGFRSIVKPIAFNLDRTGINLVQGVNGVGKSTLFNALFWCEYGINLKKSIEPWKELKTPEYKGVRVIVERSIGDKDYRICRHHNYKGTTLGLKGDSRLMIFEKNSDEPKFLAEHLLDAKYKDDQQAEIVRQLGIDDKTFLQSVIFGQKMSSLVETSPKDKREIFDTLFAVGFVDEANEKAKVERLKITNEIAEKNKTVSSIEATIQKDKSLLEQLRETEKTFDADKKKVVDDIKKDAKDLADKAGERQKALKTAQADFDKAKVPDKEIKAKYEAKKTEKEQADDDKLAVARKVTSANNQIANAEANIKQYEEDLKNVATKCPTCDSPLTPAKVKSAKAVITDKIKAEKELLVVLQKNLKEHEGVLEIERKKQEKLNKELEALKKDYDNYATDLEAYNRLKNAIQPIQDRVDELLEDLTKKNADLKKEQEKKFDKTVITTLEKSIEENTKTIAEDRNQIDVLVERQTKVDWWVKKGFGATGIKSFVFNSMLNKLNVTAQKYAERLGFGVEFTVDMTKETRPFQMLVYKGSDVKDYDDLSGGQQQRVNVCIAFAMHDLVSSSKTAINLLVMDEKFEGLDADGTEAAFELIRAKAEDKSVYVITHSHIIDVLNSKTIEVVMENGTTTINDL